MATNGTEQTWEFKINPWLTMIPIMLVIIMFALDETISNVALPYMAGTFSISHNESTWIITSYLVASGIMIPAVDFFSKLFGRKQYLLFCIVLFTIASILCGLSESMGMMLFSRVLQGIGGGGIMPIGQAVIFEIFPKEKLTQATAVLGLGVIMAPIMGPALGGWITENWSWPFIYFINLPIGILAYILANKYIEEPPYSRKQENVTMDYSGFFFLAIWLLTLQIVLDKGNDADWFGAAWICRLTAVSVVSFILFLWIQVKKSKNKTGLIDLSVLKNKNFLISTSVMVVLMGIMMASSSFLPSMLQSLLGYTAFLSGISMMPRGLGCLLATVACGFLAPRIGLKNSIVIGLVVLSCGGLAFGEINLSISLVDIGLPNLLFGFGMILAVTPLTNISCATLEKEQQTNASGIQNLLKNVGAAIGTSIATTMISRFSQVHQFMMVKSLTETNNVYVEKLNSFISSFSPYTDLSTATYMAQTQIYQLLHQQATLWGYIETFRYYALASLLVIPFVYLLHEDRKLKSKK